MVAGTLVVKASPFPAAVCGEHRRLTWGLLDILVQVWLRHLPREMSCKGQGFTPWYWGIIPNQGLICAWEGIK